MNPVEKSPQTRKTVLLALAIFLSFPVGGVLGGFLGLVSTTFIPQCCSDSGCRSCLEFQGMIGYEASAYLGFWIGLFLFPLIFVLVILYRKFKAGKKTQFIK